jgi:hypothetical protein
MAEDAECDPAWTAAAEALRALLADYGLDDAALVRACRDVEAAFATARRINARRTSPRPRGSS